MKFEKIRGLRFNSVRNFTKTYKLLICVGFLMAFSAMVKIFGLVDFSSDWFWFIAGLGLVVEGTLLLAKQKKFDNKYEVVEKSGENIK